MVAARLYLTITATMPDPHLQSTIAGNTATGRGGGVINSAALLWHAALTLTNSTISGNTAAMGGGLVNAAYDDYSRVTATLLQSTITGNTAIEARRHSERRRWISDTLPSPSRQSGRWEPGTYRA